jgi:hypothetical protein
MPQHRAAPVRLPAAAQRTAKLCGRSDSAAHSRLRRRCVRAAPLLAAFRPAPALGTAPVARVSHSDGGGGREGNEESGYIPGRMRRRLLCSARTSCTASRKWPLCPPRGLPGPLRSPVLHHFHKHTVMHSLLSNVYDHTHTHMHTCLIHHPWTARVCRLLL